MKIAFIGAGRMAEALISRLPRGVLVSDIKKDRLSRLKKKYKVKIAKSNLEAFQHGEVVMLSIKPQHMAEVLNEVTSLGLRVSGRKLIISIAAGIPLSYLQKKLPGFSIVRAMPNNPCLVGEGIIALARGKKVRSSELGAAKEIFKRVGEVIEVPEKWMDAVTGLSGSGPAFIYRTIEGLTGGGVAAGLPKRVAAKLALQTALGSAKTLKVTGKSPEELRGMVTSPGGTTIEGIKVLEKRKFSRALLDAVVAAAKKSRTLSQRWTL